MIKPDLKLLRDHGVSGNRFHNLKKKYGISYNDPFCMKFENKKKKLYYIASIHTNDPKSRTFRLIKNIINKVEFVIVEGINFEWGLSPDVGRRKGEMKYATTLAIDNRIPFSGVEPSDKYIYKRLIDDGIKKKDIVLFEILREYKVFCKNGYTEEQFYEHIKKNVFPYLRKMLKFGKFEKFNFHKYFEKRIGEKFIYCKIDLEISSPNKNGKYITNRISAENNFIRDAEIIKNLYKYLNQYDNILFIYGQNHYYAHLKILEKTFGKPIKCFG